MNVIQAGCTLHIVEPPKPHLWIVLTDPVGDPQSVVTVMLVTSKSYTDPTVILRPGDHSFITVDTSVHYSTARHRRVTRITAAIARKRCDLRESLSRELLEYVQRGLLASPFTVNTFRDHCLPLFGFDD